MNPADTIPADLARAKKLSLATSKRAGVPVATPVWFAASGGELYVATAAESFKVKRLRHDPRAPRTRLGKVAGAEHRATARILDLSEAPEVHAAVTRRYGLQSRAFR